MSTLTPPAEILADSYRFLQKHVYTESGIVLEENKQYLFECRLAPLVRQLGLESINDLCALLRATTRPPGVARQVVEAMTTNETYFFRDPAHYDAIRTVLLPRLMREKWDKRSMRFWSAACSNGQEAYSLAMQLLDGGWTDWNIQILGTDYSSLAVERARSGKYQQIEVNRGLPAALLIKHFRRAGVDWQLSDAVRAMARFETIDLRQSMRALGPFDLVFCRNVMIYFDAPTRKAMLQEIHGTLFRRGWLLLGGAETAFEAEEWFERQTVGGAIVYVAR
ncbi:MAG TPA: protein-glutamate O-methyltransferase CheR [Bryobacteraceae bacterium]